jgi:hypothetical protein
LNYKLVLVTLLAFSCSECEESRKKIIESKDMILILYLSKMKKISVNLNLSFFLLSIGRVETASRKSLLENNIQNILYENICSNNTYEQLLGVCSLCNYLLDSTFFEKEELEYIIDLILNLISEKKSNKHCYYSLFALKNLAYSNKDIKETKKVLHKKISIEKVLEFLEDQDYSIQEQALILIRGLLYLATPSDDIASSYVKMTRLSKKFGELVDYYIKKIGVGYSMASNKILSKDDASNSKIEEVYLFNLELVVYNLMQIYIIGEKYQSIVRESGIFKNLSVLLVSFNFNFSEV